MVKLIFNGGSGDPEKWLAGPRIHHRDEPLSADFAEQASEMENFEVLVALDKEGKEELEHINAALTRIESGQYNECSVCGKNISHKRLEAIPYTVYCLDCADSV